MRFPPLGPSLAFVWIVSVALLASWRGLGVMDGGETWDLSVTRMFSGTSRIGQDASVPEYVAISARELRISFDPHPVRPLSGTKSTGYPAIVNGSYFGKKPDGTYYPAGLWLENGTRVSEADLSDPNLGVVVAYRRSENSMRLQSATGFDPTTCANGCLAFQSGPLIASGRALVSDFRGSWHALEPHERTILGIDQNGSPIIFAFPKPIPLPDAGRRILHDHPSVHSLVNLDGGPSTAFVAPSGMFRPDAVLPITWEIVGR